MQQEVVDLARQNCCGFAIRMLCKRRASPAPNTCGELLFSTHLKDDPLLQQNGLGMGMPQTLSSEAVI